jgi:hypothetical protein
MALLAQESGLMGLFALLRKSNNCGRLVAMTFCLVCPGVRPKWAEAGDQKRSMTPSDAIKAGADYLVIGRPITAATDPVAAWERICDELAAAVYNFKPVDCFSLPEPTWHHPNKSSSLLWSERIEGAELLNHSITTGYF